MAIDSLSTWKQTFTNIPKVNEKSWAANFSNWCANRVNGKAELTGITTATPPFTFSQSVFKTQLEALGVTTLSPEGAVGFATAWQTAVNASLILTVVPGDFINPESDPTKWSVVTTALIDPASVAAAKAFLVSQLTVAIKTNNSNESNFPQIFRDAFLLLTGTTIGLNSLPIPLPLVALNVPLI
jgi:hypothetical protein